jgi:hypothetical protein
MLGGTAILMGNSPMGPRMMPISLNLNPDLIQEAIEFDANTSIDAVVETALREYINQRKRLKIVELFGTIDYEEDYDYKQQRALQ